MADDKNLNIRIDLDADTSGAEAAKRALEQVEDQARETAAATSQTPQTTGFGGQLDQSPSTPNADAVDRAAVAQERLNQASAEYRSSAPAVNSELDALATSMEKVAQKSDGVEQGVSSINTVLKAEAIGRVANSLSAVGQTIQSAASGLKDLDPALASNIESAGGLVSSLGDIASMTAQGAAVAGPWGAAIAAALGVAKAALGPYIDDMKQQLEAAKASTDQAALMGQKHQELLNKLSGNQLKDWARDINEITTSQEGLNRAIQADLDLENLRRQGAETRLKLELDIAEAKAKANAQSGAISQAQLDAQLAEIAEKRILATEESAAAREQARVKSAETRLLQEKNLLQDVQGEIEREEARLQKLQERYAQQKAEADGLRAIADADPTDFAADTRANDAERKVGATDATITTLEGEITNLKNGLPKLENNVALALQAVSIIKVQAEESINQIADAADAQSIIAKTNEVATAVADQNATATQALQEAKTATDATIADITAKGESIPAALKEQSERITKLLTDSIPDSLQIAEIQRASQLLQQEQTNFGNATISALAQITSILVAQGRKITESQEQLKQLETTVNR